MGEISLGEMGLGEMGLGEMGQNRPRNNVVQNHKKRLLIAKMSHPFKEIVVAESNGRIEIYFWPTLVAMVTKVWDSRPTSNNEIIHILLLYGLRLKD